jgi:hypothetical protein
MRSANASEFASKSLRCEGDCARDDDAVQRVQCVVRVAVDVDVAESPAQLAAFRDFLEGDARRDVDVARLTVKEIRIAGALDQQRHPRLGVQPAVDEQVRLAQLHHEAGLGAHVVHVLRAPHDAFDLHVIAADLTGDVGQGGRARHHADLGRCRLWRRDAEAGERYQRTDGKPDESLVHV